MNSRLRWSLRLNAVLFTILFLALLGGLAWLSTLYSVQWRWAGAAYTELSQPSRALLARLEEPLQAVVFAPREGTVAEHLQRLLRRYADQAPAGLQLEWVDPRTRPDLVRELGIERAGELVLRYRGAQQRVRVPTEQHISAAIERLLRTGEAYIAYLTGHGERSLEGETNHDLGRFGEALRRKGYRLQALNLARMPALPDNLALLVLADPQVELLPGEQSIVQRYLREGGSLLLLAEAADAKHLAFLEPVLGLRIRAGLIRDPQARELLALEDQQLLVISAYPEHPATRALEAPSLLPRATMLSPAGQSDWVPLLRTGTAQRWEPLPGVTAKAEGGPLWVAATAERAGHEGRRQRLAVLGDADFLSNAYLGNGANLPLGLNLVDWLAEAEGFIGSYARPSPDQRLSFAPWSRYLIGFGFLLGLPLLFLGLALWRWWRRRAG
ncbi:Gldg family protein [Alkalilimnicola sp. S0819]|uniref:Gldg family protein n=1 Tax=Alkalilimnicola sp. S0819 TaxID=2613922 RepID=UPI00186AA936|nr:Gldg family protein [Alkalilimnicola sp. S0819]